MKRFLITALNAVTATAVSVMLVLGSVLCLLNMTVSVDFTPLILTVLSCSLAGVVTALLKKGRKIAILAALFVGVVLFLYFLKDITLGFDKMLYHVTYNLNYLYGTEILGHQYNQTIHVTFVLFMAGTVAYFSGLLQGFKKGVWIIIAINIPFICYSLLYVNASPAVFLILITAAIVMLVFTNGTRRTDPFSAFFKLTKIFLPIATVMALLVLICSPVGYIRPAWIEEIRKSFEFDTGKTEDPNSQPDSFELYENCQTVDLYNVGQRNVTGKKVLEFKSSKKITYLKGVTYGEFTSLGWNGIVSFYDYYIESADMKDSLDIKTVVPHTQIFTSYYTSKLPAGSTMVGDSYVHNAKKLTEYRVILGESHLKTTENYDYYVKRDYLQIDKSRAWYEKYIVENDLIGKPASYIANFVKNSAVYDINAKSMKDDSSSADKTNFVKYFLTESKRGYCVHFATATVMLLRACGIPARYVTGYASSDWEENTVNVVTDRDAHAWVEYYVEGTGWFVLEPTPGMFDEESDDSSSDTSSSDNSSESSQNSGSSQTNQSSQESSDQESSDSKTSSDVTTSDEDSSGLDTSVETEVTNENETTTNLPIAHLIKPFLIIAAVIVSVIARRYAVLACRAHKIRKSGKNKALLLHWKYLVKALEKQNAVPDEGCLLAARKARFGNKEVTDAELYTVKSAREKAEKKLAKAEKYSIKRFWHKYINILY